MKELKDIKCFLLDMDGTIYLDDCLIDGALEFLQHLEYKNKDFIFLTNNSSKNKEAYKEKLADLGYSADKEKIFTSGEATILYLKMKKEKAKVFLMGNSFLEEEFTKSGFRLVKEKSDKPDFVVLGFDTTLNYEKIWMACDFIMEGVPFIATHPDFNCPLKGKKFMPDTGSMIKMFEASTGKSPLIIGKPNKYIIYMIIEKYKLNREEIAIVGDRLYTDIKAGEDLGITTILVLTGETTEKMYKKSQIKADYVFNSIKDLITII
ncbi:HAD-IIA family hydrolase [Maledivibacter halophilus]|uniref:Acid sugar phosphatase n=1 Tax=Maledivibacter halophilus TaxID=36842 RepID=A0A1T5M5C3_9FIRM|nr:HAD-IIA family hydrolase [Maledivibacter halophilus]SKC83410.1 HAD-superfamily subfamily IIA hydrolase, TIGR01457 [Maledivibacter halophilus]